MIGNIFVMIGAAPNTDWLEGCLTLDEKGFVATGPALTARMLRVTRPRARAFSR